MAFLDVTQTQLVDALGVRQPWISRRCSGETPFDIVELAAIAELLGCEVSDFLPAEHDTSPVDEFRQSKGAVTPPYLAVAA